MSERLPSDELWDAFDETCTCDASEMAGGFVHQDWCESLCGTPCIPEQNAPAYVLEYVNQQVENK